MLIIIYVLLIINSLSRSIYCVNSVKMKNINELSSRICSIYEYLAFPGAICNSMFFVAAPTGLLLLECSASEINEIA